MIPVVFDTGVLISAIGWRGPAYQCLVLVARRQCRMVVSVEIFQEYEKRVPEVLAEQAPQANANGPLSWVRQKALWVEPSPLGKQRSSDPKDERFIAAGLSANAQAIISYDRHFLDLEKPFGIPVMRPAAFIAWMEQLQRS